MVKRRLTYKQPAPPEYCHAIKRRKVSLQAEELVSIVRVILRHGDGIEGRAKAFSYAVLCCERVYDENLFSQLPLPVLQSVLDLLVLGSAQNPSRFQGGDHRVPAVLPSNMVMKPLQGLQAFQVKFMMADFKVESGWTMSYPQAIQWHRALAAMKATAAERLEKHKKKGEEMPPITWEELLQAFVTSPSLELTFSALISCNRKRISTYYTTNYLLAMQQWLDLKEVIASCKHRKKKDIDAAISEFKDQAITMVESEKSALARRERQLIASISAAIQLAKVKVGQQLQHLIGLDQLNISPEEVTKRLEEAPPMVVTKLQTFIFTFLQGARRLKDSAVKVNDKRKEKGAPPSPLFDQGSALLPQILAFVSLRQVTHCRRVSMNFLEASNLDLRQRLRKFVYSADFLNGISQTRSGRRLNTKVETQVRHLIGLLSTPCLAKFFQELNLRDAPKEALSANNIAPLLARMISLRTVVLPYEGKEWANTELSRICKALPQGASMESYDLNGKPMAQFVQGSPAYRLR